MDFRAILMGLGFALMWSSAFTSGRIIVQYAPPLTALAIRFLISGVLGVIIARMMGQSWRLSREQWQSTVIFGLCQNALYLGLIFVAMQWVEASVVSIIASTMPLMVAFFGWLLMGQRLKPMAITGLVAGVIGVSLIMGARITGGIDLAGLALCLLATLALTVATLAVRSAAAGGDVLMIVGLQMLVGAVAVGIAALLFETWTVTWSPRLLAAFTYTTLVPGLLATWVWFRLVGRIGAVKAASFHFLNPFFGVAVAAALLGERLGSLDLIGVAIIAVSIFMVQMSKREPAPREGS